MAKRTEQQLVEEIAKPELLRKLHVKCDSLLKTLAAEYPQSEVDTWAFQVNEARAFLADPQAQTPFMDAALKDGEDKTTYANLILTNNDNYSAYAGSIVRLRRSTEEQVNTVTTLAEVSALETIINGL